METPFGPFKVNYFSTPPSQPFSTSKSACHLTRSSFLSPSRDQARLAPYSLKSKTLYCDNSAARSPFTRTSFSLGSSLDLEREFSKLLQKTPKLRESRRGEHYMGTIQVISNPKLINSSSLHFNSLTGTVRVRVMPTFLHDPTFCLRQSTINCSSVSEQVILIAVLRSSQENECPNPEAPPLS